jgi:NAD+ synthase (glutamine-hydrolysing)
MLVYVAQLNPIVGDIENNVKKIVKNINQARKKKADIVLFAELAICGYPPEDLVYYPNFIDQINQGLETIIEVSKNIMVVVGTIRRNEIKKGKFLYNSAAVIVNQQLVGYKDKTLLPTYDVFDERRYFESNKKQKVFEYKNKQIAVTICEDLWQHGKQLEYVDYTEDPVEDLKLLKPDLLLNLSASPYYFKKKDFKVEQVYAPCARALNCPLVLCNQVGGNDSLIFDGYSVCLNKAGEPIKFAKGFVEDDFLIDLGQKHQPINLANKSYEDLYQALVLGVRDYFFKQGFKKACIGLSGGIDSALVTCIAVDALGSENVLTVSMPSRYTSKESVEDANILAKNLKIDLLEIPIDNTYQHFLDLLNPHFEQKSFDTTEENLQARIRGIILMAISNKHGYIILSTGNKSEMAVGYSTLYGDMCGGLGVINDVIKTNVFELALMQKKRIPKNILTKKPSAELRENQKDQDTLPEYDLLDKILLEYVEHHLPAPLIAEKHQIELKLVNDIIEMIHKAEYKRRQSPPGLRVSKKAFSKGRMFPIVQKFN